MSRPGRLQALLPKTLLLALAATFCNAASAAPQAGAAGCDFRPPGPMLQARAYADQDFRAEAGQVTREHARLPDGTRILVRQSQCVDFIDTEFILIISRPARPASDRRYWLEYAAHTLASLRLRDERSAAAVELGEYLRAAIAANGNGRLAACRDGSAMLGGPGSCSFEQGGSYVLRIDETKGSGLRIRLTLTVAA